MLISDVMSICIMQQSLLQNVYELTKHFHYFFNIGFMCQGGDFTNFKVSVQYNSFRCDIIELLLLTQSLLLVFTVSA